MLGGFGENSRRIILKYEIGVVVKKEDAIEVRGHALNAIKELMTLFHFAKDKCSPGQHEKIKKGVGLAIGKIQMEILEVINEEYPELDDLIEQETIDE